MDPLGYVPGSEAVLHGSWFCHTCPRSASNPNLYCQPHPEPAMVLTCNELDPAPFVLSFPVPLSCTFLDKSPDNSGRHETIPVGIRETVRPARNVCFFFMRRAVPCLVTMRHDTVLIILRAIPSFASQPL